MRTFFKEHDSHEKYADKKIEELEICLITYSVTWSPFWPSVLVSHAVWLKSNLHPNDYVGDRKWRPKKAVSRPLFFLRVMVSGLLAWCFETGWLDVFHGSLIPTTTCWGDRFRWIQDLAALLLARESYHDFSENQGIMSCFLIKIEINVRFIRKCYYAYHLSFPPVTEKFANTVFFVFLPSVGFQTLKDEHNATELSPQDLVGCSVDEPGINGSAQKRSNALTKK